MNTLSGTLSSIENCGLFPTIFVNELSDEQVGELNLLPVNDQWD